MCSKLRSFDGHALGCTILCLLFTLVSRHHSQPCRVRLCQWLRSSSLITDRQTADGKVNEPSNALSSRRVVLSVYLLGSFFIITGVTALTPCSHLSPSMIHASEHTNPSEQVYRRLLQGAISIQCGIDTLIASLRSFCVNWLLVAS